MHILLILAQPLWPLKGASFNCLRRARALNTLGCKVTILSSMSMDDKGNNNHADLKLDGIKVLERLPPKIGPRFIRHLTPLILAGPLITSTIIKERPDILHVINPPDVIPVIVSLVNCVFRKPFIFHISDPGPESILSHKGLGTTGRLLLLPLSKFLERIVMHHADGMVTISEVLKRKIVETRKHLANKPFVAQYNVSSLSCNSDKLVALNNQNYILYVGTLSTGMLGLESLIHMFAPIWEKHNTKLFIIGDGPLRKKLIDVTASLQAEEYIKLPGYIEPGDIPEYIKKSKLCVIPYADTILTRVCTPTKLFEYISMGKAVVCPDFPGFQDILGDENPGVYCSSVEGDGIHIMDTLLKDDVLRRETETMNKQISSKFEYNKEIKKIVNLYKIVSQKGNTID